MKEFIDAEGFYNVKEAAVYLQTSEDRVRIWLRQRKLRGERHGIGIKMWVLKGSAILSFLDSRERGEI